MNLVIIASGLVVALGGAIKDSRYEGFKPFVFLRSPVIGCIIMWLFPPLYDINDLTLFFFAGIGIERCVVELYKLLRKKKPAKFDYGEWSKDIPQGKVYPSPSSLFP